MIRLLNGGWTRCLLPCWLLLAAACTDSDRVLFVTTSQLGIEGDAATRNVNIGLDRYEAVVAPVYDDGALPPVYARLKSDGGFFIPSISQLYATGDAARLASGGRAKHECDLVNKKCKTAPPLKSVEPTKRKLMFFGTGTSLGLAIKGFNQAPGSINLGFKRRELSYIPLTKVYKKDGETMKLTGEDRYASTLAAINARVRSQCNAGSVATAPGVCLSQFFATGEAANGLAADGIIQEIFKSDAAAATRKAGQ